MWDEQDNGISWLFVVALARVLMWPFALIAWLAPDPNMYVEEEK